MKNNDDSKTVVVGRYSTLNDAEVARGILESSGIECFTTNQAMVLPIMDVELFVNEKDADLAKKILGADFVKEK